MAITKQKKEELLSDILDKLPKSKIVILVNYSGLKTEQIFDLKDQLSAQDSNFKIIKNTLAKKACKDLKIEIDDELFQGPIALIYGFSDEVNPAKTLYQFNKLETKPEILGAIYENKFIEASTVEQLSKIPVRKILETKLVGSIFSPISGLVYTLKGNLYSLVSILSQYKDATFGSK
jgi:large subunit ribosomal protein L10